jgi:hypothetical protein
MGAIRLVAFNQPSGTSFISWDKKQTVVRITADKHKITRRRSLSDNAYIVDKTVLKAFGTGVPKSVSDILRLSPLNFHRQHDAPFWFGSTAGEVSRQLNRIVNLDVIDRTTSNLESQKRKTNDRIKDIKKRIEEAKDDKESLSFVPDMDCRLEELEKEEQAVQRKASKSRRIDELISRCVRHGQKAENSQKRITAASSVLSVGRRWDEVRVRRDRLVETLGRVSKLHDVIHRSIPNIKPLIQLEENWMGINDSLDVLSSLIDSVRNSKKDMLKWERKEKRLRTEFKRRMGKGCPLCGNRLNT